MNTIVVIFSDCGARIIHGANPSDYTNNKNALINPEFPRGVPPHHWIISNGKIGIVDSAEIVRRETVLHQISRNAEKKCLCPQLKILLFINALSIVALGLFKYFHG